MSDLMVLRQELEADILATIDVGSEHFYDWDTTDEDSFFSSKKKDKQKKLMLFFDRLVWLRDLHVLTDTRAKAAADEYSLGTEQKDFERQMGTL